MKVLSPLVHSENVTLLKTIPSVQLIQDWKSTFQIDITEELKGYQEIYLYQCNQTQLRFFYPLDLAGSAKLYEQLQLTDLYYLPDRWEHRLALQDLTGCDSILEIGAASGYFVRAAMQAGLTLRGIELNGAAVAISQQEGLPVEQLNLQDAVELYRQSFDGICSFQVLEHVPNPKQFIDAAVQLLKPGGTLIFCVPNAESFLRHQSNLLDLPPHHMTQWSVASFQALEHLFPLKLEQIAIEPLAEYHVLGYLNTCRDYWRSRSPLFKLLFNRLTIACYQTVLNLGLRQFVKGQSLYVRFHKI